MLPAFPRTRLLAALAGVAILAPPVAAQQTKPPPADFEIPRTLPVPRTYSEIFTHRDSRAVDILQYLHCIGATAAAEQSRVISAPDSALLLCTREKDGWRGILGAVDKRFGNFHVFSQVAVKQSTAGAGAKTTASLDTLTLGAVARAHVRALQSPTRGAPRNAFTWAPLHYGNYVEVWFVPLQNSAMNLYVGGDSLIQMTADGRREHGHFSKSPPIRALPLPTGSTYIIPSHEAEVPLVSELVAARLALMRVPIVKIRTQRYEWTLDQSGQWKHAPRRA